MSIKKQFLKRKPVCKVTFRIPEEIGNSAKTAHIVGEFNNWNFSSTPMKKLKTGVFSRMIEEDVMMSGPSAQPRILFVTPEVAFMPEGTGNSFFQHRLIYHKSFGNGTLPNRFCRKNTTTSMKHPTNTQAEEMKR